jgi:FdhD protein
MLKEFECLKFHDGKSVESTHGVVKEEPLSIFINGRHFVTAMISPEMKKEFVIGHLFAETIIKDLEEIGSLQIEENIAKVITTNPLKVLVANIISGCGGEASFLDESKLPKISSDLKIDAFDVFKGVKSISGSDLHRITGGVHVVGLFDKKACK